MDAALPRVLPISALSLFALIRLQGRSAAIPRGVAWLHIVAASLFNVIGFGLFSSFALLTASTSRVVIVNYSMPVWGSPMAWLILGERLSIRAGIGLVLCVSGLSVLVYPVATEQSVVGLLLALCCALSWAAGTVYMKWARIPGDLLVITAWQIALGAVVFGAGLLVFQGCPRPRLCRSRRCWRCFTMVCWEPVSPISCGLRLSSACRPQPPRSARSRRRWSASSARC